MTPHQIYTNGIITNYKPFAPLKESDSFPVATIVMAVGTALSLIALIYIQYLYV